MDSSFYKPEVLEELRDTRTHLFMLRTHPEGIFNFDSTEERNQLGQDLLDEIAALEEFLIPKNDFVVRALLLRPRD